MSLSHNFGGRHTELKLDILQKYAAAYLTVLKNQKFRRLYIDAFAGTGERASGGSKGSGALTRPGSVRRILEMDQSFNEYYFIDIKEKFVDELERLCREEFPAKAVKCILGDANEKVVEICGQLDWKGSRGLIFIDPFGMQAKWSTLVAIAQTEAIDMLLLFPISGLNRQAALDWSRVDEHKIRAINELLGTEDWQNSFYEETEPDLFSQTELRRQTTIKGLEEYVWTRLNGQFPWVSKATPIFVDNTGPQLFSLFFAVSNPSQKAINLARKIFTHIQKSPPLLKGMRVFIPNTIPKQTARFLLVDAAPLLEEKRRS